MGKDTASKRTGGVGTKEWRGATIYTCPAPGCTYDSESKPKAETHLAAGLHIQPGKRSDMAKEIPDEPDTDESEG